jgi:hypothetical protein
MASQIGSSFAPESVDASDTSTLAPKTSINIKEHLRELPDEEKRSPNGKLRYGCNYCKHISSGSSGIRYHLKHLHQIDVDTAPKARQKEEISNITALYAQLVEKNATQELDQTVLQRMIEKKMVDEALLNLIIVRRLPFRMVEWPEFRNFCITLNSESPAHIPQNHSTITNRISKYFPEAQDIVRRVLQSAKTRIHFAVDIWTTPSKILLLAICASFVDIKGIFRNILIALRPVYSQSGESQWEILEPVLKSYGIDTKVGTLVGDNSGTNDVLCRTISRFLSLEHKIEWSAAHQRIRCLGHVLNLVVQAFLFSDVAEEERMLSYDEYDVREMTEKEKKDSETYMRNKMGVMGKLHTLVVHTRSSPNRAQEFIALAGRSVPMSNRTRWNSWGTMTTVALKEKVKVSLGQIEILNVD